MMPLRVTTTIVSIFTFTKTTYMDFVITKTSVVHKLAHQDLYQTSLTIIKTPVTVPTCTMEVTVDVSTPRGFTSTSDILVISTATTTLYVTSESTTTSTVMLDSGFESNGRHKGVDEVSNEM